MKYKFISLFETAVNLGKISWEEQEVYNKLRTTEKNLSVTFRVFYQPDFRLLVMDTVDRYYQLPPYIDVAMPPKVTIFEHIQSKFEACKKAIEYVETWNLKNDGIHFTLPEGESPLDVF